jgi:capsular exopolysaccharide synthesis family protein
MPESELVILSDPRSAAAEAYRTLRTNLMFDDTLHTLLIAPAVEDSGKTEALANLAVAFAQTGHKTIVVDADLRQPMLHDLFGVDGKRGLTTMMLDDRALAEPPLATATGVEDLQVLPAGSDPVIPSDVLSHQRMGEIIGLLKARADYVLFGSPPVLAASDALLLGGRMDGVVLMVRAGQARRQHVVRAKDILSRVNLIGAFLTNAPKERF